MVAATGRERERRLARRGGGGGSSDDRQNRDEELEVRLGLFGLPHPRAVGGVVWLCGDHLDRTSRVLFAVGGGREG